MDQQPITHDEQYFGRLWLVRDITGQKRRDHSGTLAATDALTRLPNRRAFIAHLEQYRSGSCPWHAAKRCGADD
ncbi:MAG: hypothetical protein U1E47_02305 [Rivihabitans pingtungensis]